MLIVKSIERFEKIEYASFMNTNYFNIISNTTTNFTYNISLGNSGLLQFNEAGLLVEIEQLCINPIMINYPTFKNITPQQGIPLININYLKQENFLNPILFVENVQEKLLILFSAAERDVDTAFYWGNMFFLLKDKRLLAVEYLHYIVDSDDALQEKWLKKNGTIECGWE